MFVFQLATIVAITMLVCGFGGEEEEEEEEGEDGEGETERVSCLCFTEYNRPVQLSTYHFPKYSYLVSSHEGQFKLWVWIRRVSFRDIVKRGNHNLTCGGKTRHISNNTLISIHNHLQRTTISSLTALLCTATYHAGNEQCNACRHVSTLMVLNLTLAVTGNCESAGAGDCAGDGAESAVCFFDR